MPRQQQLRNKENVDILRADFQHRNEPNFAAKSLVSAYLHLYSNRGVWYAGDCDENLNLPDLTGQGRTVYNGNTCQLNVSNSIVGLVRYEGDDWHYRLDEPGLSITATEPYVPNGRRGIGLGGWWRFNAINIWQGLMGKWGNVAGSRSYLLRIKNTNLPTLAIRNNALVQDAVTSTVEITTDRYWFIHGCFDLSDGFLRIFVGDSRGNYTVTEKATALVDIRDGSWDFEIGRYALSNYINGWMGICHLAAANQDEAEVRMTWEQTRAMYPDNTT